MRKCKQKHRSKNILSLPKKTVYRGNMKYWFDMAKERKERGERRAANGEDVY